MTSETVLVVDDAREIRDFVAEVVLRPNGYRVLQAASGTEALEIAYREHPDLIISDIKMPGVTGLDLARAIQKEWPNLPVILITAEGSEEIAQQALRAGVADYFIKPFDPDELLRSIQRALGAPAQPAPPAGAEITAEDGMLVRSLRELTVLLDLNREVAAVLDPDEVLARVVEAAVRLTGAEAGLILLPDELSQELVVRAAKAQADRALGALRLPADSLPGQVLRGGQAVRLGGDELHAITTDYVVRALIYVPLRGHESVIGVLGVDNRHASTGFTERDERLLHTLGDYAAVAIENARLYSAAETERKQLYTVLNEIEDGVVVVDVGSRLILINHTARRTFGIERVPMPGTPLADLVRHPDVLNLLTGDGRVTEVSLDDGQTLSAHVTAIAGVGRVIVLHNITHLKEMDRIKSEFVTTVSHDLRSPLTAILGYVSLLDRVGALNEKQVEFVAQVRASVQSMNALLTDLLDLGRIEAGFDTQREPLHISGLIHRTAEEFLAQARARHQLLTVRVSANLPLILMNSTRIRQMLSNLIDNAVKYTPDRGQISVDAYAEGDFVVIAVTDSGIGIPPADQPYIFDKFFRASNARAAYTGTGLGLSIVKSIADQHGGRIWVDSRPDQGATFTVMLPKFEKG